VQIPASPGGQPTRYLHPLLGGHGLERSSIEAKALYPFGHGLSYTTFDYGELAFGAESLATDGELIIAGQVTNSGRRSGAEIFQLYLADPIAEVARPVKQLLGFARVTLEPAQSATVRFALSADRLAYTGRSLERIVDAGEIVLMAGSSSEDIRASATVRVTGPTGRVAPDRVMTTPARVEYG
jgi:beta-glucosidase